MYKLDSLNTARSPGTMPCCKWWKSEVIHLVAQTPGLMGQPGTSMTFVKPWHPTKAFVYSGWPLASLSYLLLRSSTTVEPNIPQDGICYVPLLVNMSAYLEWSLIDWPGNSSGLEQWWHWHCEHGIPPAPCFSFCPGEINPRAFYVLQVITCSYNVRLQSISVTCIVALTEYPREVNLRQEGFI
jgi:hypothetical protein